MGVDMPRRGASGRPFPPRPQREATLPSSWPSGPWNHERIPSMWFSVMAALANKESPMPGNPAPPGLSFPICAGCKSWGYFPLECSATDCGTTGRGEEQTGVRRRGQAGGGLFSHWPGPVPALPQMAACLPSVTQHCKLRVLL